MSVSDPTLRFPELAYPFLEHVFTLRSPGVLQSSCKEALASSSFPCENLIEAEQPHGNLIAQVGPGHTGQSIPRADGLITHHRGITLAIRTADCGPLFLYDPEHQAIGVVHSGKKGTLTGILPAAVDAFKRLYGSDPASLVAVLAPCIRPPQYDLDFAATIQEQALNSGIRNYTDCGLNTGSDLERFYSYRMEKGQTGRHYAAIRLAPLPDKS